MRARAMAVAAAMVLLAACTVGPKYSRPSVPAPPTFRGDQAPGDRTSLADLKWFEVFKDTQLQQLVHTALANNYDLRAATVRIEAARASLGVTRADQRPTVEAGGGMTAMRFPVSGSYPLPSGFSQNRTYGGVALNLLSYEADLWGRLRHATEAARANLLASQENRKAIMTMVVGDVATAYFNLLELDQELDIARRTLLTRENSLQLIRSREKRGLAALLELRQGEQLVHTAAQAIPDIQQRIELVENQISLLTGSSPESIPRGKPLVAQEQPPAVPAGLTSALLERRPDIRAAEQNLVAANATVGVARAAYFPRISLTSLLGTQTDEFTGLFSRPSGTWQIVPQTALPIFNGGRLRSNLEYTRAQEQGALVEYQRVIQTAFREVSDALVSHNRSREVREEQEKLVAVLKDRSRLSYLRYRGGVDTLLNALDADRDLFTAELSLAQTRRNELVALVQLYRSLGGGWQQ